jgi:hypothetical protein
MRSSRKLCGENDLSGKATRGSKPGAKGIWDLVTPYLPGSRTTAIQPALYHANVSGRRTISKADHRSGAEIRPVRLSSDHCTFSSVQVEAAQKIDDLITPIEFNTQDQLHPLMTS